jgi:hypothetical protein
MRASKALPLAPVETPGRRTARLIDERGAPPTTSGRLFSVSGQRPLNRRVLEIDGREITDHGHRLSCRADLKDDIRLADLVDGQDEALLNIALEPLLVDL